MREGQKHAAVRELHSIRKFPLPSNNSGQWIPPSLTISLEDQAIAYYSHHHVILPVGVIEAAQGHGKSLPLIWKRSQRDSAFCLAILATSYSAFGKSKENRAVSKASKFMYFQAISVIQKSLQDPVDSCSDETLLAMMVLSLYEVNFYTVCRQRSPLNIFSRPAGVIMAAKRSSISSMSFLNIKVEVSVTLMELPLC